MACALIDTAQENFDTKFFESSGLGQHRLIGGGSVTPVSDLNVVSFVTSHQLIAAHAVQYCIHHRPLGRRLLPSALDFCARKIDHRRASKIGEQFVFLYIYAAPDNFSGLADSLQRSAAQRKIHRWLPFAHRASISFREMLRRRGAGNLENPNKLSAVLFAVAQIVQRGFGIETQLAPHAVGDQRIDACAFVDFIEVRQSFPS